MESGSTRKEPITILFDPMTGGCAPPSKTIAVIADTATTADALSTAFTLMQEKAIGAALARTNTNPRLQCRGGRDARDLGFQQHVRKV